MPIPSDVQALVAAAERHLDLAWKEPDDRDFGAVNWGDLRVVDVEYRRSMLFRDDGPFCVVMIEEAAPDCSLGDFVRAGLIADGFPETVLVECNW